MFESLVTAALRSGASAAVGAWARVENAACARRLFAMADELEAMFAADGSLEREQWCLDNWDAVAASVGAAQNVSLGVAAHQLLVADALRHRLPRVAEVFAAGTISYRMAAAVVSRTRLIKDTDALAKVDTEIAAHVAGWGALSVDKTQREIDYWVDRHDPAAVRRSEERVRGRFADVRKPEDGSGTADIEARLFATDAEALDQRLDAMAAAVCDGDPRTLDQRRSDALGALGHGAEHLTCQCDNPDCDAADAQASAVAVHVIAHEESLSDDTPVELDGKEPRRPWPGEPLTTEPPTGPANTAPAALMGGGLLPAPLLAAKIAGTAKIVPIRHPGNAPPQPRYIPTAILATFIRCRDMTCRFPAATNPPSTAISTTPSPTRMDPPRPPTSNAYAENTTYSKPSAAGTTTSGQTAPWCGRHRTGRPTPLIRAAEYCSPPCANPPHPSPKSRCPRPTPPPPTARWPCPDAKRPEPSTAPKPSTTNADTTKASSKPRQKNAPEN